MKRNIIIIAILAVLLIAGLILGLTSCPKQPDGPSGNGQETTAPTEPSTEAPTEPSYAVEVGQLIEVIKQATKVNGENGVTYYYTEDGVNLTPFDEWNEKEGKWVHGDAGVLCYPALVPADNYTAAGTSATEYVAISYELPETGAIELFSWTALQGGEGDHGYRAKIALGTPDNVLFQYDTTGPSQTLGYNTYGLKVNKGDKIYVIYEPLVKKDLEWFGFKVHLAYTGLGPDAMATNPQGEQPPVDQPGDSKEIKFTSLVGKNNGMNGLTFYRTSDGKKLTALDQYDSKEGKWYYGSKGVLVYPKADANENYGIFGSSEDDYIVIGYKLPATGTIDLATWCVLQSGHDYQVKIASGSPENVIKTLDVKGDAQTTAETNVSMQVKRGDMLYIHYKPLEEADGAWGGYKTQITYTAGGDDFAHFDPNGTVKPNTDIQEGTVIMYADLGSTTNGKDGLTYYYTENGKKLTKFTESAGSGTEFRWIHGSDGVLAYPALVPADNYGLIGTSAQEYTAIGYKIPATGTVEIFNWIALQSGDDYQVRIAKGTPENILYTFDVKGASQTIVEKTHTLNVKEGQMLYILFKPLEENNGAWAGFKTQLTYVSVGEQTGPSDPSTIVPDDMKEPELPEAKPVADIDDGVTKILAIGNSFTVDTLEYVQKIAKSAGVDNVHLGKAVIGGASIDLHASNAKKNSKSYELGVSTADGGWFTVYNQGLWEALQADNWDIVMIQQHSPNSGNPDSYGNLDYLMEYIANYIHEDADVIFNMTWAYQQDSDHSDFGKYDNDQMTMYDAIVTTTQAKIANRSDIALVLPSATVIQNARTSYIGDTLTMDGYHMNHAEGRYSVAMGFAKIVLGVDLSQVTYRPAGVSELYQQVAVESVNNAAEKPYEITLSQLTADKVDTSSEIHRDTVKFADIATTENGKNGLTFYYTADGTNLIPYTLYDAGQGRWYDNSDDQLNMFDPQEVRLDNYGLGQLSATKHIAMGYKAPETGSLDLFALTVIQGPEGTYNYTVSIALGTPDNVVHSYTLTGVPGNSQEERYTLDVTKDQEIFIIYESTTPGGWFGYKNTVTYRTAAAEEPEVTVNVGDTFTAPSLAPANAAENGANGLTYYYTTDGTTLTKFTNMAPETNGGRWWHSGDAGLLAFIDPYAGDALVGSSNSAYVVMGYKMPAAGTIDLKNILRPCSGVPGKVIVCKGDLATEVATLDFSAQDTCITQIEVAKDEEILVYYKTDNAPAVADQAFFVWYTEYTYTAVAEAEPDPDPETEVKVGDTFTAPSLAPANAAENGANGLTYYYTTDGTTLTKFANMAPETNGGRWWHSGDAGLLAFIDPYAGDALVGSSNSAYVVMGYKMPAAGTIDLKNILRPCSGVPGKIIVCKGDLATEVATLDFSAQDTCVTQIEVAKDEEILVYYKTDNAPAVADQAFFVWYTEYTYTAVAEAEPDPDPETEVKVGDTITIAPNAPVTDENGTKLLTVYYTTDGTNLTPFSTYDPGNAGGRWYHHDGTNLLSFMDPFGDTANNYGRVGVTNADSVVLGYKMPATGTVDLYNWVALHSAHDIKIQISKGAMDNVVFSHDVIGGGDFIFEGTAPLAVTENEMIYVSYTLLETAADANTCYIGFKTQFTYTALGSTEAHQVSKGTVYKAAEIAPHADENGTNGVTIYYSDGINLTPFTTLDPNVCNGRWYQVEEGAVATFVDPFANVTDNYGQIGMSGYDVVIGYEMPATGKIDLFTWCVLQSSHDVRVTVSQGTLDNVVATFDVTGESQALVHQTDSLFVTAGDVIYVTYELLEEATPAAPSLNGYISNYQYTAV